MTERTTNVARLVATTYRLQPNERLTTGWWREAVFDAADCERIMALAEREPGKSGETDRPVDGLRDSEIRWLYPAPETDWFFDRLQALLLEVNQHYRFELKGFYEGAQIATYAPGGHYGWHMDIGQGICSNRKLSMSVQLSDAGDYDGGDLEFRASSKPAPRTRGTLIVFPSYLEHRITPVTRGQRISLVSWIAGPPFR